MTCFLDNCDEIKLAMDGGIWLQQARNMLMWRIFCKNVILTKSLMMFLMNGFMVLTNKKSILRIYYLLEVVYCQ